MTSICSQLQLIYAVESYTIVSATTHNRTIAMHVKQELLDRNSCDDYRRELTRLLDAGAAIVHVRTRETLRCALNTRKIIASQTTENEKGAEVPPKHYEWNIVDGLVEITPANLEFANVQNNNKQEMGIAEACDKIVNEAFTTAHGADQRVYYTIIDPHLHMERNPYLMHFIQVMSIAVPPSEVRVVFITPDEPLPSGLSRHCSTISFKTPGHAELVEYVNKAIRVTKNSCDSADIIDMDDDDISDIALAGLGMTGEAFDLYLSVAIVERFETLGEGEYLVAEDFLKGIARGKTEVIKQSDLLELYHPEDIGNVGGMDVLKEWISKRRNCYSDEAAEFGIEAPKGIVAVGCPGTGKSLMAKAVAGVLGIPLVRLDFGRVFNSLVGASEERIRQSLALVESMAPCVLFVDEVDKGLAGMGGSGDAGTSSRVLGTFLTWLNDNTSPVFTVVTANNVTHLPPELLRKGRFDQIFTFGLPLQNEIEEVLDIHLRKRGHDIGYIYDGAEARLQRLLEQLLGFVPAEIEAVVKDALVDAFSEGSELTPDHIENAAGNIVPMIISHLPDMLRTLAWVYNNGVLASNEAIKPADIDESTGKVKVTQMAQYRDERRIRGLNKGKK